MLYLGKHRTPQDVMHTTFEQVESSRQLTAAAQGKEDEKVANAVGRRPADTTHVVCLPLPQDRARS